MTTDDTIPASAVREAGLRHHQCGECGAEAWTQRMQTCRCDAPACCMVPVPEEYASAAPAPEETPSEPVGREALVRVRLSMLEHLCRDWKSDDPEYEVLIGVVDGEPMAFCGEYPDEGVYNLHPDGPEGRAALTDTTDQGERGWQDG